MTQQDGPKGGRTPNDKSLKGLGLWFFSNRRRVKATRGVVEATRRVAGSGAHGSNSKSANSSQHSTGASRAAAEASRFLETILATTGPITITQKHFLDQLLIRVEQLPIHKIEATDNAEDFKASDDTWRLIKLAAQKSADAYSEPLKLSPNSPNFELKPSQDSKRILGTVTDGVLVVSVRGSVSKRDWMVNVNGEPVFPQEDLGETTAKYHKGFLAVAEAMQEQLAERILAAVKKLKSQTPEAPEDIDLLLTGHSAGGAMAQLFYAMAASESSRRAIATVAPNFRQVHCIVFGAPPITTIPIHPPRRDPFQSGIFLGIINEGDPIPVIQQDYFHRLIEVFALDSEELKKKHPNGFKVPDPVLRVSGPCIVLRDNDASSVDVRGWNAVKIREEMLERKLFGNVAVHSKEDYLERCKSLGEWNGGFAGRSVGSQVCLGQWTDSCFQF